MHQMRPATEMMDLLSSGTACWPVGGSGAAWLTARLLCLQGAAVTFGSTSARPTTAASTTNASMIACVWKVSLHSWGGGPLGSEAGGQRGLWPRRE